MDVPSGSLSPERSRIADHLAASRERILKNWLDAIEADERIPSADLLTREALRDHFPEMLGELTDAVRNDEDSSADAATLETGKAHGRARWRSGYRLDEVLRELGRVRELILGEIATICRDRGSESAAEEVAETVRLFFDTIAARSAQQFVRAQDAEVTLRADQLEHAYEQAQAATERMRAVVESRLNLLRAVNHELRNALQPVGFAAEALLEEPNPINRREIGSHLVGVAGRLQALLDRLVRLSKLLAGEVRVRLVPVDVRHLLRDLEHEFRPLAEKRGLRFELVPPDIFPSVVSDPAQLREIGGHLLANSVAFTSRGFIRLEAIPAEGERWILRVTDSGRGIDPIDARQVFQEMHPRKETAEAGLRLGLIVTRHLARLLDGEVSFHSVFGEGTCFEVSLPCTSPARD